MVKGTQVQGVLKNRLVVPCGRGSRVWGDMAERDWIVRAWRGCSGLQLYSGSGGAPLKLSSRDMTQQHL